jgi:hypothetical protein
MNNVLRVIENWIIKNEPTPDPSEEGNPKEKTFALKNKTIPGPSQEGNS